uniref:CPSF73 n=1 Tax=Encephalitozoon cuniculi TaxID=6035 RepID=UPI00247B2DE1|nr:Chain A, CPSF73 [Encephalitozoon cuniculi]
GSGLKTKSVRLSKMGKKELLVSVLKNHFMVEKENDDIKVMNGDMMARISGDGVTGDAGIVDKINECIKKIEAIYLRD